ncbi:MAG TPA: DUF1501 domain-containing protein [Gemmataceae bacterium]|jgi:hypothetical protein|nr:DUF1501 domain-containing protein [Gemmataceae bacterium]
MTHLTATRRGFLQIGGSTAIGFGVGDLFARRARAAGRSEAKSVILVNLTGGMSHIDCLDMKPEAPAEVRGEFQPISTAIPGIQICEHLPMLAARMKHWALVRSMAHRENGHLPGSHRLLTGATMPNQRQTDLDNVLSRRDWPCYAAGLNYLRPRHDGVPNGVTLPHALIEGPLTWPGQHGGFLGPANDPLFVTQDPNAPSFRMDALAPPPGDDSRRAGERLSLLNQLDRGIAGDPNFRGHQERAVEMLTSGRVVEAFRLDRVPDRIRDRYGRNQFGQSLLLARRLVQAGVPIVQANMGIVQTWDTHVDNWGRLKTRLLPWLDRGLAALIDDLESEGQLANTFVAALGEFGRTPKVSNLPGEKIPGRDHWAHVYSALFAGGGVAGGRVIGKSDRTGGHPVTPAYTPFDFGATVYQMLGVEPGAEIRDALDRPTSVNAGSPMTILFQDR